jgi:hypothetical protein
MTYNIWLRITQCENYLGVVKEETHNWLKLNIWGKKMIWPNPQKALYQVEWLEPFTCLKSNRHQVPEVLIIRRTLTDNAKCILYFLSNISLILYFQRRCYVFFPLLLCKIHTNGQIQNWLNQLHDNIITFSKSRWNYVYRFCGALTNIQCVNL